MELLHPATIQSDSSRQDGDLDLVERARRGDTQAFTVLVERYERQIFRLAKHITEHEEDAEDVLQETFLKAYRGLEAFRGDSRFYTWLVRIAVNEALVKLRKRRADRTISLDEPVQTQDEILPRQIVSWEENPEELYRREERKAILTRAIESLPLAFRAVFLLRDVEELSTEETAAALNLSVPAVKSRLMRARLHLREKLNRIFAKHGSTAPVHL